MDWARAKTILIVIFLLLNIFLVGTILYTNANLRFQSDYVRYAKAYLESKSIRVNGQIPDIQSNSGPISYTARTFDFDGLTKLVFGHKVTQALQNNALVYSEGSESISLAGDVLTITDQLENGERIFDDKNIFLEESFNYVSQLGFSKSALFMKEATETDSEKSLVIGQKYQKGILFDQDINIKIDKRGLLKVIVQAREVKGTIENESILSPYQVLVMSGMQKGTTISDIEFGYKKVAEGELYDTPVWCITLANGTVGFFNATTGEKLQ